MLTHIDLFSGIGGFALAAQWTGFKTIAFVEIDEYCQEIIKQNFGAVMADAKSIGGKQAANGCEQGFSVSINVVCDTYEQRYWISSSKHLRTVLESRSRWLPEPNVGRVAHGIPKRVDRLKGLGNAIVPQVAYEIIKAIALREEMRDDPTE